MKEGHLDVSKARLVAAGDVRLWNRRISPREGDVILSRRTNPGETAVVPASFPCVLGQNLVILRSNQSGVDQGFLRWLVRGPQWWNQIEKFLNVGAVFDSLRCADVPRFELTFPPSPEQRAIASVLDSLDCKIDLNRDMSQTLEQIARALFKSWFVDFDPVRAKAQGRWKKGEGLPGMPADMWDFWPSELEESEFGGIPGGWTKVKLRDLSQAIFSGGTPDTRIPAYWGGEYLWLSSGETRNRFITSTERSITKEGVKNSSTRLAQIGDVVIASAGQGGTRGQTSTCAVETYINQSMVVVRADPRIVPASFLFLDLSNRYEELRGISDSHSIRGSLTTKMVGELEIVRPPDSLATRFGSTVEPILGRAVDALRESKTLAETRDALLPKLLSGEIRVPAVGGH